MTTLIVTIHILICVGLIILVLLQSGKEGMGVIFGGGSQSVFGSSGAGGLLVKLTAVFGAIFLITSLAYNVMSGADRRGASSSVMSGVQMEEPAVPPAGAPEGDAAKAGDKDKAPVKFEETAPPAAAPAPSAGAGETGDKTSAEPEKEKPSGQ
ncbi:preprotein translocase subunit SecG [Desulfolutivibrio sulfoxidireducens]|uniref:preprotein translocase subunit SecG n=1 Tax=Desulfolutivibrio sulfoxidireducens TaxID=2773299 RepID=UPI00159D26AC|nr:preprotein translocase subunit SecG [Desulfolutivibrio sulfoxidireducens]QLA16083.1 preprotein translocase subunit SecG [Desulfolutivibrio sulfoxidireducens]QLA21637.1 preprotein translocase subunit SecG [Desulfolutivibrio sulfoxidireducens]